MTISTAFRFQSGVVLCTDTQITYPGLLKLQQTKLASFDDRPEATSRAIFAISGSVAYARMTVEECKLALSRLGKSGATPSMLNMHDAVERTVRSVYKRDVFIHPYYRQQGGPDFQLLFAVWSSGGPVGLFSTDEAATQPIVDYLCLGAGTDLAYYLIESAGYRPDMTLEEVMRLSVSLLKTIKNAVDGCGGYSQFIALTDHGKVTPILKMPLEDPNTPINEHQLNILISLMQTHTDVP